jgi:hypothetical protein
MDGSGPAVRGRRIGPVAALAVLALAGARPARAQTGGACAAAFDAATNPLPGGTSTFAPADFGNIPEVCSGSEAWLRVRGELVDASGAPDFFGRVVGTATLRARHRVTLRSWLSLSIDLLDYAYVNDAGLAATGLSFGPATVGYHWTAVDRSRGALAIYGRALLPIDTARQSGVAGGLELGASGRAPLAHRLAIDGGVALPLRGYLTAGQAHAGLRTSLLAEAWWATSPRFAVVAGLGALLDLAPTAALVALAPRAGLRAGVGRHHLWLAFLAEAPVAGFDRTTVVASAFLGWTP